MDLLTLTDSELKIFLEDGIPLDMHRHIYMNNPKLAQKLKGFRPNTVPLGYLVQTSTSLIKKEKNNTLIRIFSDFYDDYKKNINNNIDKMISDGYPESIARSLSIVDGYNEKFLPVFFKLEGINEDEQKKIFDDVKTIELIEKVCSKKTDKLIKDNSDRLENNNKLIDSLKNEMKLVEKDIKLINDDIIISKDTNSKLNRQIESIEKDYVSKSMLDLSLSTVIKNKDKDIENLMTKMANSDSILELQNDVRELKKLLKEEKENYNVDNINVTSVLNEDYEVMDDYLSENIGDVIENYVSGDAFDVLREYLIEIIYSDMPIICSEKNSKILANILSSIITGGNYYTINVSNNILDDNLVQKIDSIPLINGNKVIIIKNKIGVTDCGYLLEYIKCRPSTEKFIFEVAFDKELLFLPSESLEKFHFFISDLKDEKINYKYSFDFSNEKRKSLTNFDYENSLEAIGVSLSNKQIMNVKFYGILAFSIIPFIAINSEIEPVELVNKLLNSSIRKKCEAVIHD